MTGGRKIFVKEELRERGAPTSGQLKVILQRRLLIIAKHGSTAAERRVRQSDDARCRLTREVKL